MNGAQIPLGAHPGNTGGKPGRSGRPPNELREAFRSVLPDGIDLIHRVIMGEATITLRGKCEHCGEVSKGPTSMDEVLKSAPTVDNRLRAIAEASRFGLGERSEFSEDVVANNVDRMLSVAETMLSEVNFKAFARHVDVIWNEGRRG
ncbi:MAG: hypothetical protein JWL61_5421 [Gemmatimonadetes bacterium]|nr:hypothetical protein [Gemmatimonadota bacterium]